MGNAVRRLREEGQKSIVRIMESLTGRFSLWDIWQDFVVMTAITIANVMGGPHQGSRKQQYMDRAKKYSAKELEAFSQILCQVTAEMDLNPDQDFLGELFMALDLGNQWKGQFFTPYSVCRMISAMTFGNDLKEKISKQGWVSVSDPACGAGALLIAFANECRRPGNDVNYQTSVLFVAQDIDFLAGCMCYIQLSLMGCPGYVVIGDSIAHPATSLDTRGLIPQESSNVWYTPMYFRDVWHYRRLWAQIDTACQLHSVAPRPAFQPDPLEPSCAGGKYLNVTKTGQLTLF